jgi:Autophagy-related protein 101
LLFHITNAAFFGSLVFFSHVDCSIRSPGPVTPRDVECEGFNVTYTRIASGSSLGNNNNNSKSFVPHHHSILETDVDRKVDESIESFLRSLSQIGPELLSVSLHELFYSGSRFSILLFHHNCSISGLLLNIVLFIRCAHFDRVVLHLAFSRDGPLVHFLASSRQKKK